MLENNPSIRLSAEQVHFMAARFASMTTEQVRFELKCCDLLSPVQRKRAAVYLGISPTDRGLDDLRMFVEEDEKDDSDDDEDARNPPHDRHPAEQVPCVLNELPNEPPVGDQQPYHRTGVLTDDKRGGDEECASKKEVASAKK